MTGFPGEVPLTVSDPANMLFSRLARPLFCGPSNANSTGPFFGASLRPRSAQKTQFADTHAQLRDPQKKTLIPLTNRQSRAVK
ncbi:hypothetical protein SPMU_09960 [Sphingomonas mucosissima]|uniref:Uncharacterized protein n=1 Tax=Sphingomonas mucosissima TaxID=370959 RepID=A0A245ZSC8_9SPHN|nr:hypothetical protein SPMU_09960 [Sphingomonas mucosissima]